jgi:hypothetical protein
MENNSLIIFIKKRWFLLLIIFFTIINFALSIYNLSEIGKRRSNNSRILNQTAANIATANKMAKENSYYDSVSPDFIAMTIEGKKIKLSEAMGKLIILRFSRFYLQDLPDLLYLEHLAKRFGDYGVDLIFINTLGKHDNQSINKIINLSFPIIEDNSFISSIFNAAPEETVVIDKFFKIKFKLDHADREIVFEQVKRCMLDNSIQLVNLSDAALADLINKISYRNIKNDKTENIADITRGKKIIINLFISTCFGCPEGKRLALMRGLSEKINHQKVQIVLLFGKGNGLEIVKEYISRIGLDQTPIVTGVIERNAILREEEYFKIFEFGVDPRLLVLEQKGILIFLEKMGDANKITEEYLLNKL